MPDAVVDSTRYWACNALFGLFSQY